MKSVEQPQPANEQLDSRPGVSQAGKLHTDAALHAKLSSRLHDGLGGHLAIELVAVRYGYLCVQLTIQPYHLAANGYLHAGTVVTLADTACGFGCIASLPAQAANFTTMNLQSNFLRTATEGVICAEAQLVHGGRRTQVWDATVYASAGDATTADAAADKPMALFRCTQMLLYPET